jgi:hypothetical protein
MTQTRDYERRKDAVILALQLRAAQATMTGKDTPEGAIWKTTVDEEVRAVYAWLTKEPNTEGYQRIEGLEIGPTPRCEIHLNAAPSGYSGYKKYRCAKRLGHIGPHSIEVP